MRLLMTFAGLAIAHPPTPATAGSSSGAACLQQASLLPVVSHAKLALPVYLTSCCALSSPLGLGELWPPSSPPPPQLNSLAPVGLLSTADTERTETILYHRGLVVAMTDPILLSLSCVHQSVHRLC
ncbi:hypothetical protein AAHC03_025886 [Spirometra sp. Aus1]